MENLVLTIHLILALLLIGVVLMQRSEGGALLSGGGNTQARGKATVMTKLTWVLAIAFIITSLTLTVLATRGLGTGSVLDGLLPPTTEGSTDTGSTPSGASLLPPSVDTGAPAAPPRADEPLAPPAAETPATGSTSP